MCDVKSLDSEFKWYDGSSVLYTPWAPDEPNGNYTGELCVEMYSTFRPGLWNDLSCDEKRRFVCKAEKGKVTVYLLKCLGYLAIR